MTQSFTQQLVVSHQTRLKELGYYSGQLDGIEGQLTSLAFTEFKKDNKMAGRDYPGPLTLTALWSPAAKPRKPFVIKNELAWMTEARRLLGVKEVPGAGSNPVIMQWSADMDQWYPDDSLAWCGLFVAHCMTIGCPDVPQGFNRLGAREWLKYGHDAETGYGGIAVFSRPGSSWAGHVGFIAGGDKDSLHILGGNQSDQVNVLRISRSRLLGVRKPYADLKLDTNLKPATTGDLSINEA